MFLEFCQLLFGLILLSIFVIYFGHPSYVKYQDKKTLISEETVMFDSNNLPAVNIIAKIPNIPDGWKTKRDRLTETGMTIPWDEYVEHFCNVSNSLTDVVSCIKENTFELNDMIDNHSSLANQNFWTSDISVFHSGKVFTLNTSYELGSDLSHSLQLDLNENLHYSIWINDPKFFITTVNPRTIPHILLSIDDAKSVIIYIDTVYHKKLDRPGHHCEASESHDFSICIKTSLSIMIGCRLEWDVWSSLEIPVCTEVEQLLRFEKEYFKLMNMDQATVVEYTGCNIPCTYTEYKLATAPIKYAAGRRIIQILLSSSQVSSRTEEIIYPFESFVSEL